jgi:hypothetical protein
VLSKADERVLGLFQIRVLRCIFGAVLDKGTWRKRYNHELYKLLSEPRNTKNIKINRFSWAGHTIHVEIRKKFWVFTAVTMKNAFFIWKIVRQSRCLMLDLKGLEKLEDPN